MQKISNDIEQINNKVHNPNMTDSIANVLNFSRKKANSTYNLIPKTSKPQPYFSYLFLIKGMDFY